jgi:hypothetical protein
MTTLAYIAFANTSVSSRHRDADGNLLATAFMSRRRALSAYPAL